jgi:type VI secretion system secreted protein Hcp
MAVDMFLKIEGIPGESTDKKHKDEIDVISFSWGATQSGGSYGTGGRGAGKVQMQDFSFVMKVNKASPKLMLSCATGEHIPNATLVCRKAGGEQQEYLTVKFTDVLISSYQTSGSSGDDVPMDQCALNFDKIEFEYKPQKPDGTLDSPVKTGYNLKENVKV